MKQNLSFEQLPRLAIAEGATSPNPGGDGILVYSTTLSKPVWWNGAVWSSNFGAAPGGAGYSIAQLAIDVDALTESTPAAGDFDLALRDGTTPQLIKLPSIAAEVVAARGDRMNLNNRITAIANFASPNGAQPFVGQYYDNNFHASAAGTFNCATNRINAVPFISSQRQRIDRLGIGVTGAHASLARLLIYSSDPNTFLLDQPLYVGALELDCTTTGFKEHTLDFTFDSGRQYWLAVNTAGTPTIRGISVNTAVNFGLTTADATAYRTLISRSSVNPSDPPPNPFNAVVADVVNLGIAIPSIRMRVAAL